MPELLTIGKLQILRRLVVKQIHFMSKVECSQYESCLTNLNQTVLNNLQEIRENAHNVYLSPENEDEDNTETPTIGTNPLMDPAIVQKNIKIMLSQLTVALETVGIVNPFNKVYYLTKPLENMALFMHLFTLSAL